MTSWIIVRYIESLFVIGPDLGCTPPPSLAITQVASPRGFEPLASALGKRCSIQLSYGDNLNSGKS